MVDSSISIHSAAARACASIRLGASARLTEAKRAPLAATVRSAREIADAPLPAISTGAAEE